MESKYDITVWKSLICVLVFECLMLYLFYVFITIIQISIKSCEGDAYSCIANRSNYVSGPDPGKPCPCCKGIFHIFIPGSFFCVVFFFLFNAEFCLKERK